MLDVDSKIEAILEYYDIGALVKIKADLGSGFQSDNTHILTEKGDFVIRVLYDSEENVNISMKVYEYLALNGLKTPMPIRTKDNKLLLTKKDGESIVIQTYIEGSPETNRSKIRALLPFFGKMLGKVHFLTKKMVEELGKEVFVRREDTISAVRNLGNKYKIANDYISGQFKDWEREIEQLPCQFLTKAVIHGDIGPKDFFFNDGIFTGIIDFNAAGYDYLLFDIAPMMMYCGLYRPKRIQDYLKFIGAYLKESPVKKEEFKWLYLILKTRWLGQIFYHQYRYVERITKGSITGRREENLQGVRDGILFLKMLDKFSHNDFFKVL